VIPWTRLDRRARSAAAVLLAALAVAGSLLVGPSTASQSAGSAALSGAAARGSAPAGVALRDHRDLARSVPRRSSREQSAPGTAPALRTALGHGPAPVATLPAAVAALLLLGAAGPLLPGSVAWLARRPAGTRRDRAPPALALA
jgi:hypothetical protein